VDGLRLVAVGYGHPDATQLIETVQAEYVARYGGRDESPVEPLMFEPPHGTFLVGYAGEVPVATGAWRRRTDLEVLGTTVVAEIKRMYVVPDARGASHARTILAELERTAAEAGIEALVLETGLRQPEAIGLYTSSGYTPIPGFGHYRESPLSRCFGKRLQRAKWH
jgi:GNAT superfamily N-acetyltransferase